MEQRSRYDLALDHLAHHFKKETLPLAPPRGERPADLVKIREGTGAGKPCVVCGWLITGEQPLPNQRPSMEYVYQSGAGALAGVTLSFHGDCHAAWVNKSESWRREHP